MPAFTIRPNGQGSYSSFTLGAGASKPAAMSDSSDATFIFDPATGASESYTLENLPATAGAISGALTWHMRGNKAAGGTGSSWAIFRVAGVDATASYGPGLPVGAAVEQTATFASPPGGGSWTPALVNALEAGIYNGLTVTLNAHDMWVTGTYGATTGGVGFIFTMGIGPLLVIPTLGQFARMATPLRLTADELREAWEAYRAFRWPAYSF